MAKESSFDIVSTVDIQEVDNAFQQAKREISQRYDLKDSGAEITLDKQNKTLGIHAPADFVARQVKDVIGSKLVKRGIELTAVKWGEPQAATGQSVRLSATIIDGIDKADLDFPGDLLWELERGQFQIAETGAVIQARHPPLVLLTSNGEKELPAAFLRRCLFYVIPFPEKDEMRAILSVHTGLDALPPERFDRALEVFYWIRSLTTLQKKPGTSELLDWLHALALTGTEPDGLPYLGTLLKLEGDWAKVQQYWKGRQNVH